MTGIRSQSPKRRGRPPLRPGKTKRASFTTRLTADLKQRLERDAAAEGRSLSEVSDETIEEAVGGTGLSDQTVEEIDEWLLGAPLNTKKE